MDRDRSHTHDFLTQAPEHQASQPARQQQPDTVHPAHRLQRVAGNRFVQQRLARQAAGSGAAGPATQNALAAGGGRLLSASTRASMERAFGADLSGVRVHTDAPADRAAQELNADAFTSGRDIYFGAGNYQPNTGQGKQLLAHELTHTLQQGSQNVALASHTVSRPGDPLENEAEAVAEWVAGGRSMPPGIILAGEQQIARQESGATPPAAPASADNGRAAAPGAPTEPVSLGAATFTPPASVADYLQTVGIGEVPVRLGSLAQGTIRVRKRDETYDTADRPNRVNTQAIPFTHPALEPLRQAGVQPVLALRVQGNAISGYATIARGDSFVSQESGLVNAIKEHSAALGWAGLDVNRFPAAENRLDSGTLRLQVNGFTFRLGGFMDGTGTFGLANEAVTFSANTTVHVQGLTDARLQLERDPEGNLGGRVQVPVSLANFAGNVDAVFANGIVDITGTARYTTQKLSGEVTLLVTDAATARNVALQRLGPEAVQASAEQDQAPAQAGRGPRPGPRALAGWGVLDFRFTEWMTGRAQVIIDNVGHITVVGEITPPAEVELFPQRDYIYQLFRIEVRTLYGVPLVGNVFLFANVGMDALAKLGPGKIYNIRVEGTYSTDPQVFNRFSLAATLNISAFAGLRLRGEGGAGVELLDHDIKAGAGVNALAGVRGYVEATPTIGYRERENPEAGREGEFYIHGHMELAAQPFLGLGGDLFVELDSPWWSPAPDKKWTWPLGQLEYPLPGEFGIGADVDYVIGSSELPEIQFGEVDFNASKFMTDLMNDHVPPSSQGEQETQGEWQEGETTGEGAEPELTDSEGAPAEEPAQGQQEPGEGEAPAPDVQQRWLQGLEALGRLAEESRANPFDRPTLDIRLASIRSQYQFSELRVEAVGEDWAIYPRINPDPPQPVKVEGDQSDLGEGANTAIGDSVVVPNLNKALRVVQVMQQLSIGGRTLTGIWAEGPGFRQFLQYNLYGDLWHRPIKPAFIGFSPFGAPGQGGRIRIDREHLRETPTSAHIPENVRESIQYDPQGTNWNQAGHLVAHVLGGPGGWASGNIVPMTWAANRLSSGMPGIEGPVKNDIEDNNAVYDYQATPQYGTSQIPPEKILVRATRLYPTSTPPSGVPTERDVDNTT